MFRILFLFCVTVFSFAEVPTQFFVGDDCVVAIYQHADYTRVSVGKGRHIDFRIPMNSRYEAGFHTWCQGKFVSFPSIGNPWYGKTVFKRDDNGMELRCLETNGALERAYLRTDLTGDIYLGSFNLTYIDFEGSYYSHHGLLYPFDKKCENLKEVVY